ncbi:hypothetical protein BL254_05085 [Protofrankia sp. BMG5.30]|uniref:Transposase n=1 Tax=Protofrankia coriariae TaxID=1562887 RepID=A0ABR5F657_9ACTN|nr:hypothetical protein [Protofrankia coriariae]KLL12142.1 hypothetical protein FrCorBMG51_06750 [Protofrankia coriariae]ONH37032.1 hypothetical protein BL254_05085 [Protofrankia sp. BMG5.30]
MERVGGRRFEPEMQVELPSLVVQCVYEQARTPTISAAAVVRVIALRNRWALQVERKSLTAGR